MRQHGLERVGLRMGAGPHEVVIRVGGVDLVEAVGVTNGADQLGVGVDGLKGQSKLLPHTHGDSVVNGHNRRRTAEVGQDGRVQDRRGGRGRVGRFRHGRAVEHDEGYFFTFDGGFVE